MLTLRTSIAYVILIWFCLNSIGKFTRLILLFFGFFFIVMPLMIPTSFPNMSLAIATLPIDIWQSCITSFVSYFLDLSKLVNLVYTSYRVLSWPICIVDLNTISSFHLPPLHRYYNERYLLIIYCLFLFVACLVHRFRPMPQKILQFCLPHEPKRLVHLLSHMWLDDVISYRKGL